MYFSYTINLGPLLVGNFRLTMSVLMHVVIVCIVVFSKGIFGIAFASETKNTRKTKLSLNCQN